VSLRPVPHYISLTHNTGPRPVSNRFFFLPLSPTLSFPQRIAVTS